MSIKALQEFLNSHGAVLKVDGKSGPATRAAIQAVFTNRSAPAITADELKKLAERLGCTVKQLAAVASVESSGGGFDKLGRSKILYERHIFHRLTNGKFSPSTFSQRQGGGYSESSWAKLGLAVAADVEAAFASCSWGKFQVMGMHWEALDYPSALEMAYSTVGGEAAHYDMLVRFIEHNNMKDEIQALSANPEDNRAFARQYNGSAYEKFQYHVKLANAMR
jgi:hypothetical protein